MNGLKMTKKSENKVLRLLKRVYFAVYFWIFWCSFMLMMFSFYLGFVFWWEMYAFTAIFFFCCIYALNKGSEEF